ncbi:trace amine-associated receptor 5-like [Fundulus heteroclitus]|uniref:trace amine-associated receptor 5-like n=1 Tax=Fundulus heteroclitus TaxID=8078 RepID=UPI00165AAD88|nr:trace amine-associated receptor 5-like [Fundulus heteroclitus]
MFAAASNNEDFLMFRTQSAEPGCFAGSASLRRCSQLTGGRGTHAGIGSAASRHATRTTCGQQEDVLSVVASPECSCLLTGEVLSTDLPSGTPSQGSPVAPSSSGSPAVPDHRIGDAARTPAPPTPLPGPWSTCHHRYITLSPYRSGRRTRWQLHTPTNILLLSLAVSDFLVGLLLMPLEIYRNTSCWFFGDIICVLYCFLIVHIVCASIGNIVLISVDRYIAICDPLHYPNRISTAKAKCFVCLCWLWYAFYSIFFLKDELIQPGRMHSCAGECSLIIQYVVGTIDLILNFVFPVTIIIVLYTRVFVVALSQARAMRSHITSITLQRSLNVITKSDLKAARTLGILIVVYLVCFCPYYFYSLIEVNFTSTYGSFVVFLFYFNSCLNPLIYTLFYPWFRKAIRHIVSLQILQPGSCEVTL